MNFGFEKSILFFMLFLFFFLFSGCVEKTACSKPSDCPLSDEEYIRIAKTAPETQEFLKKYPDVNIFVQRGVDLAVNIRVGYYLVKDENNEIIGEKYELPFIGLRVLIDPKENKPVFFMLECAPKYGGYFSTADNIIQTIQHFECLTN